MITLPIIHRRIVKMNVKRLITITIEKFKEKTLNRIKKQIQNKNYQRKK